MIHGTPKRTVSKPMHGEPKMAPVGVVTCPPSAVAAMACSAAAVAAAISDTGARAAAPAVSLPPRRPNGWAPSRSKA